MDRTGTTIFVRDGHNGGGCGALSDGTHWRKILLGPPVGVDGVGDNSGGIYAVADLPDAVTMAGAHVFCSDGTVWRVTKTDAMVSTLTPNGISGLVTWYSARDIVGLGNNDPVTIWPTSAIDGDDADDTLNNLPPTYKTNVYNGQPCVRFLSSGGQLTAPLPTTSVNFTMVVVSTFHNDEFGTGGNIVTNGAGTTGYGLNTQGTSGIRAIFSGVAFGDSAYSENPEGLHVFMLRRVSGTTTLYIDGQEVNSLGVAPNPPLARLSIGTEELMYQFAGDIAEILLWDNAINLTSAEQLREQFNGIYGIGA
jgi:hypothetical protein